MGLTICYFENEQGFMKNWVSKHIKKKPGKTSWGAKMPFGQLMQEFQLTSWCSNIAFDATGDYLAISGHDSSLSVAQGGVPELTTYRGKNLPFTDLEWISGNQLVAVGHDRCPYMFEINEQGLKCLGKHLGKSQTQTGFSAMQGFQGLDLRGQTDSKGTSTCHSAPINGFKSTDGVRGGINSFATFGGDGLVFLWPWNNLKTNLTKVD